MVRTSDDIKAIATEIASQIIAELKKPIERPFNGIEARRKCDRACSDKKALMDKTKQ